MDRTFTVLAHDGQGLVRVIFSEPPLKTRVKVEHISDFDRGSVSREVFQVIRELKDSGLVREIDWDPNNGLIMYLRRGQRWVWLVNRLESILGPVAKPSRQVQSADR